MIGQPDAPALPGSDDPAARAGAGRRRDVKPLWGWAFISPWIVGFVLFTAIPMAMALYFSLTDFDLRRPERGPVHRPGQLRADLRDPNVAQSLSITLRFAVIRSRRLVARPSGSRCC